MTHPAASAEASHLTAPRPDASAAAEREVTA
jgi:hypothetical protein